MLSTPGQEVPSYFLIGRVERVFKTVSAPDLIPLNTDGAALPIFSAEEEQQEPEYFKINEAVEDALCNIEDMRFITTHTLCLEQTV